MKKIKIILSGLVLVAGSASAQVAFPDYSVPFGLPAISYKVSTFAAPVAFTPVTVRQIDSGAIRLPLQIVPGNPTPLTAIQPRVYLVPTPAPVIPTPSLAPIKPYTHISPFTPIPR